MAVNSVRGDVALQLGDQDFVLRPTYQALTEIESATGKKIVPLAIELQSQTFGFSDVVSILVAALKAGGQEIPADVVGEMVISVGLLNEKLSRALSRFFIFALTGEEPGSGEEDEEKKEGAAAGT